MDLLEYPEREGHLTVAQEAEAIAHFWMHPQRDTNIVRAWLQETFGIEYSHPGAIKLMHQLGFNWKRPKRADPVV